jgi:iron complex transport system substrate-binding protein
MTKKTIEAPGFTIPGIEDITRRDFLVGGAAALLLGGCGSDRGSNEPSGERRPFEHAMGTTEVPVRPERVVALDSLRILEPLLQLDITPAGAVVTANILSNPGDIERVGTSLEPSIEAIAALEPDLIVGEESLQEEMYDQLSQIAPTVLAYDIATDGNALDRQRFLAELVGRLDRFEELVSDYEGRVEGVRNRLAPMRESLEVSPLNPYAESDVVYCYRGDFLGSTRVLSDLGIPLSAGVRELPGDSPQPQVSFELIPELDADVIFALFDPRSEESEIEAFRASPLLEQTFAAENGQVFEVNSDPWYGGSVLALNLVLDDIERYLLDREIDTSGDFR